MRADVETLTRITSDELLEALGVSSDTWLRPALDLICRRAARQIALEMAHCDGVLARRGLRDGALEILPRMLRRLEVSGAGDVPRDGPLLIASNHPGLSDVLAIFACLQRNDLRIVAADYPLLRALPGVSQYLVFIPRAPSERRRVLRTVLEHLNGGGAVLILPAGGIEPDPAVLPGAVESLAKWSSSLGLIVRHVPDLDVVPAVVRGILSPRVQRHPLTYLRRKAGDRQRLATTLQVLLHARPPAAAHLSFGRPLPRRELIARSRQAITITDLLVGEVRALIDKPPLPTQVVVPVMQPDPRLAWLPASAAPQTPPGR